MLSTATDSVCRATAQELNMTAPLNVIAVSGGAYRPSRTQVLSQAILDEFANRLNMVGRIIELADLARDVGGALSRKSCPPRSRRNCKPSKTPTC